MELEYELHRSFDEAADALQNICPKCHSVIYGNYCPICKQNLPKERYYDPGWEDYAEKVEEENKEYFGDLNRPNNWTEVKDEDVNA